MPDWVRLNFFQIWLISDKTQVSQVSIKQQRDVILKNPNQVPQTVNQVLVFISTQTVKEFYDGRLQATFLLNANLNGLVQQLGITTADQQASLVLLQNVNEQYLIHYKDLFTLYVKNDYLEISPADIIKISSWLNNQWLSFSNSKIF